MICTHAFIQDGRRTCGNPAAHAIKRAHPSRGCVLDCAHYDGPARPDDLMERVRLLGITVESQPITPPPRIRRRWFHGWLWPWQTRAGKCGCQPGDADERTPLFRWLGVEWFGWPWPLRLRWKHPLRTGVQIQGDRVIERKRKYLPLYIASMPGCGCTVIGKTAWRALLRALSRDRRFTHAA